MQLPVMVRRCPADGAPCELGLGMLEELSDDGARLVLESPLEPGTRVTYDVPGTTIAGRGVVMFNRAFESPTNVRFAVGIQRMQENDHRWELLEWTPESGRAAHA